MGAAKRRRQAINGMKCIFCGGIADATTQDHVPARAFFERREWPEGFVFPACQDCNEATRLDEMILAFLAPLGDSSFEPSQDTQWQKIKRGITNNFPQVYDDLFMSSREKRSFLKEYAQLRMHGIPYADQPLVKINARLMSKVTRRVGYKIGAALYFKHNRRPLPPEGACYVYFNTNIEKINDGIEEEILKLVPFSENLKRGHQILNGQVTIRVNHTEDGMAGAYLIGFRGGLALIIFVTADRLAAQISGGADDDRLAAFIPTTWREKYSSFE